ncbi:helix-hairpin-helix domain-containing protein [Ornithinimicrobium sp. F0845]|uniref:helix-hairpin-helix domain-containing protein n=1 Tax=Ornithinimicrobium sp. F0845 TaxID=2926412 RepID=UPI001FF523F7|nr:helix-hairpin-helix domain-containing protein [Ornithinimicrobium sp. F0845]MCK0113402.1 helix-hairpin-helix domain-containing protein [Ornithinimicrobium sp. F0845]
MSERDRLAELLERVTHERQTGATRDDGRAQADGAEPTAAAPGVGAVGRGVVTGGEWLPQEAPQPGARHRAERAGPGFLTWPEALRSVRLSVRPAAVVGVLLVALLASGILGVRWWRAEQSSHPVPVVSREGQQLAPVGSDEGVVTAAPATAADGPGADADRLGADANRPETAVPERVLVHVAGQVREPGVVTVDAGARVQDAVEQAGGLTEEADTSRVNLARAVTDGERIWVPRPGEEVPAVVEGPPSGGGGGGAGAAETGADAQVNLNTADQAALEELPGVGPVTAAAILQWRADHGQFSSPDELLEVSGIGEATLEKLLPHVTL